MGKDRYQMPDFRSGVILLLFGIVFCFFSIRLGFGSISAPGPGFMPFVSGLLLSFLSLVLLLQVLLSSVLVSCKEKIKFSFGKVCVVLGSMLVYGVFIESIGFVFVTFVFVTFLVWFVELHGWKKAVLVGAIATAVSFTLFDVILKNQLPHTVFRYF